MNTAISQEKNFELLRNKRVAIIGFGSQGHAHALNLRDNGISVIVGLHSDPKSKSAALAQELGFEVYSNQEAVQKADVIMLAAPDMRMGEIYQNDLLPYMRKGKTLAFCHGFAIHYQLIQPPKEIDVILISPKAPGRIVREEWLKGRGVPALIAVHQNRSKEARKLAWAWAHGIGCTRAGVFETTFEKETQSNLFAEQAVLCGGLTHLILAGCDTLLKKGFAPEMVYFEIFHQVKLLADLLHERGVSGMLQSISDTARYGHLTRGPQIIDTHVRNQMKKCMRAIESGAFAKEWIQEYKSGQKKYEKLMAQVSQHPIEKIGVKLRKRLFKEEVI